MTSGAESLPPKGPALQRTFEALVEVLNKHHVRYAIVGGLAMIQHTRLRATDDIDALVLVPQITMPAFFGSLQDRGFQIDLVRNIRELRDHGLTSIQFENVVVDLLRPVLPAFGHVLERAFESNVLGQTVRIGSAEGLIVMKLIAFRPLDQADIQDLVAVYKGQLDLDYIRNELNTVMAPDDARRKQFESWVIAESPEASGDR